MLSSVDVDLELIVIDQSSNDDNAEAVAAFTFDHRLIYFRSEGIGLCHFRNMGVRLAGREIVLFTDDDVTVRANWVATFASEMASRARVAVAFCRVEPSLHDRTKGFIPDHHISRPTLVKSLLSKLLLAPGGYHIGVWLGTPDHELEQLYNLVQFSVDGDEDHGSRRLIRLGTDWRAARMDNHLLD